MSNLYHSSDISCYNNCSRLIYETLHNSNTGLHPGFFFLAQRGPLGAEHMTVSMMTTYSLGWMMKIYQEKRFHFLFVQQLFDKLFLTYSENILIAIFILSGVRLGELNLFRGRQKLFLLFLGNSTQGKT